MTLAQKQNQAELDAMSLSASKESNTQRSIPEDSVDNALPEIQHGLPVIGKARKVVKMFKEDNLPEDKEIASDGQSNES